MPRSELFLGNLHRDTNQRDIEDAFDKYGKILRCEVKNKGFGACYAFLEFDDERDAEDALRHENGKDLLGSALVVEFAKGKGRFDDRRGGGDRGGYGRNGFSGGRDGDRRGGGGGRDGGRSLECYNCGQTGHFARECRGGRRGGGDSRRDDRDRGGSRRDRSRERSGDRKDSRRDDRGGGERRRHQSRSPSPKSRSRSPSYDRDRAPAKEARRSRSADGDAVVE